MQRRPHAARPIFAALLALSTSWLTGCMDGQTGDLAATKTGDLSNPAAPRGSFDAVLRGECGTGELTEVGLSRVTRHPYLQQMTASSVQVLLTTDGGPAPEVVVTLPDGTHVRTARMVEDSSARGAREPQWVATVEGLTPRTTYCYEVGGLTQRTGFKTPPARGAEERMRFVAFGDSGAGGADQRAVRDQMMEVPFDLILHTGDVAYDEGKLSQLESRFFRMYRALIAKVPAYPSLGNHDYETGKGAPYLRAFSLAENGGDAGRERWYSFDWGSVHFIALDTERIGAAQSEWLERDLSANDLPWKVAYFHKPPYSHGEHGDNPAVRGAFAPIFERYGVQLVLSGHDHDYERFKAKQGVHYVVTGGGGNPTRGVGAGSDTAFSEAVLHFVLVEVEPDHMLLHAIDGIGQEFDSLRIDRQPR